MVHGHCHHKSVLDFDSEGEVLDRLRIDFEVLDSGCCGMAGSFGFEEDHYEVAQACGERALLPAVREADPRTLIITDGFSCREMLEQNGLRRPLHSAEVLHMAMQRSGRITAPLATDAVARRDDGRLPAPVKLAAGVGAVVLAYRGVRTLLDRS